MASLDHSHIVRMIGVCKSDCIMLILELAPLGPLNKYLKRNAYVLLNFVDQKLSVNRCLRTFRWKVTTMFKFFLRCLGCPNVFRLTCQLLP